MQFTLKFMFLSKTKVLEFCPKFCITFPLPVTLAGFPGECEGCGAWLAGQHPPGWLRPPGAAPAGSVSAEVPSTARHVARSTCCHGKGKPSRTSIQPFPKTLGHMPQPWWHGNFPGVLLRPPSAKQSSTPGGGPGPQAVYSMASLGATTSSQRWLIKANKLLALDVLDVPLTAVAGNVTSQYSVCKIGLGLPLEERRGLVAAKP